MISLVSFLLMGVISLCSATVTPSILSTPPKYHILAIYIDDYGFANFGPHIKEPGVKTPNFDALVADGVLLNRSYVFKFCSPSRSALQSGRNPIHVNVQNFNPPQYNPNNPKTGMAGVATNFTAFAEHLTGAGYKTHMVGKWDAGMATMKHTPRGRGYADSSLIFFNHAIDGWVMDAGACPNGNKTMQIHDIWGHEGRNGTEGPQYHLKPPPNCYPANNSYPSPVNMTGCTFADDLFLQRVLDIVQNHDPSEPLHVTYTPHMVHQPLEVAPVWDDQFGFIDYVPRRVYAAMVTYIDNALGKVVEALKTKGLYDSTLIFLSSDNGGPVYNSGDAGANNYPLRGGKASNWEGGVRVNAFVSGGAIPESQRGTVRNGLITSWDWYATFGSIAGYDPTDHQAAKAGLPPIDGIDQFDYVMGYNSTPPRSEVPLGSTSAFHDEWGTAGNTTVEGLIVADYENNKMWKILLGDIPMDAWMGPQFPNQTTETQHFENWYGHCGTQGCLFEVLSDPSEYNDVASQYPQIREQLFQRLLEHNKTVFSPDRLGQNELACTAAVHRYNGFWGPFVFD